MKQTQQLESNGMESGERKEREESKVKLTNFLKFADSSGPE